LYLRLERSIFRLGETIPVYVECNVEGGISAIRKVTALLVQEAIYIVDPDSKDEARQKERMVVAEAVDGKDAGGGETQCYNMSLKIEDRLPLTDYPWCDFIQVTKKEQRGELDKKNLRTLDLLASL